MVNDRDLILKMVGDSTRDKEHMGFGGEAWRGGSEMEGGTKLCTAWQAAARVCFLNASESHRMVFK